MSQSLAVEADRRGESPLRTIEGKQLIHIASIHIMYDPVCPHTLLLGMYHGVVCLKHAESS